MSGWLYWYFWVVAIMSIAVVVMALTSGLARVFVASLVTVGIVGACFLMFRRSKAQIGVAAPAE
jgi:amino acid transporter